MIIYVNQSAHPGGDGSKEHPFCKISQAAEIAMPGDEVLVAPGVYREDVNPVHAGTKEQPIVYRSEQSKKAVITGAEIVDTRENYEGDVWKTVLPNSFFA